MALSAVEIIKSIGSFVICDYETGIPKYMLQSIENMEISPVKESSKLVVPRGTLDSDEEITGYDLKFKAYEYPLAAVEHMTGGVKTTDGAETNGEIVDIANVKGTSVYDTTTGCIPAIDTGDTDEIKYNIIVVEAKDTNTVTLYGMSDVAFKDGTDKSYADDLCVIKDDVDITADTSTGITGFGFKLIGGTGTIGLVAGDTMRFRIRRPNKAGGKVIVGGVGTAFAAVTAFAFPKKKNDMYRAVHIYKFSVAGMPISMGKEYSQYEISASLIYDTTKDGYYEFIKE